MMNLNEREAVNEATAWWRDQATSMGVKAAECTLAANADWEAILDSGRHDLQEAFQLAGLRHGKTMSLLEIGCGLGRLTFVLSDYYRTVMGSDVSPGLLEQAAARNNCRNVRFALGDGRKILPQSGPDWDVVFCAEVFHHLDRDILRQVLSEAYRLLRPGGQFVFQINVTPITWRTRLARIVRTALHLAGIPTWRGWPNAPGFRRRCHTVPWLITTVKSLGFHVDRVVSERPCQTWFTLLKPEATDATR